MKGSDLLPALSDHTEESLIKQWEDSESQLSTRSDVFRHKRSLSRLKKERKKKKTFARIF